MIYLRSLFIHLIHLPTLIFVINSLLRLFLNFSVILLFVHSTQLLSYFLIISTFTYKIFPTSWHQRALTSSPPVRFSSATPQSYTTKKGMSFSVWTVNTLYLIIISSIFHSLHLVYNSKNPLPIPGPYIDPNNIHPSHSPLLSLPNL